MSLSPSDIQKTLEQSGDPELAFRQWESFQKRMPSSFLKEKGALPFLSLFGNGYPFLHWIEQSPSLVSTVVSSPFLFKPKGEKEFGHDLNTFLKKGKEAKGALRRFRHQEMTRIIIRELHGIAPYEEIGKELALLADSSLNAALTIARREMGKGSKPPSDSVIIGLGKLGGEDLNFSSDVDLLFAYSHDGEIPGTSLTEHEQATKLFKKVMELMQEKTEEGFVFRVDTNLRPEGKKGPLANSVDALENYYETWGSNWERTALLKARLSAGSKSLAKNLLQRIHPFVYRHSLDMSAVQEIKEMKRKINEEEKRGFGQMALHKTFNVKLGRGGIREVEFFVSAFQLLYGAKTPSLQQTNTLLALQELGRQKLIPPHVAYELREAYIFLRRIENRLQIVDDQQTHLLPESPQELQALARRGQFAQGQFAQGKYSAETMMELLKKHTDRVNQHFEALGPQ